MITNPYNYTELTYTASDGVAYAIGIDDKRFVCIPFLHTQIGGMVKVRITDLPEQLTKQLEKVEA